MLLVIVGLHFVLGSIWLLNKNQFAPAVVCFVLGMAATHFGWKKLNRRKSRPEKEDTAA